MDQQCRARTQMQSVHYDICKQSGRRPLCITPDTCPGPDYAPCTDAFNDCFTDCGGKVLEIEAEVTLRRHPDDYPSPPDLSRQFCWVRHEWL